MFFPWYSVRAKRVCQLDFEKTSRHLFISQVAVEGCSTAPADVRAPTVFCFHPRLHFWWSLLYYSLLLHLRATTLDYDTWVLLLRHFGTTLISSLAPPGLEPDVLFEVCREGAQLWVLAQRSRNSV